MIIPPLKSLKASTYAVIIGSFLFCTFNWFLLPSPKRHGSSLLMEGNQDYWRWECNSRYGTCQRQIWKFGEPGLTLRTCQMTCHPSMLWPLPNGEVRLSNKSVTFNRKQIKILPLNVVHAGIRNLLETVCQIFLTEIESQQTTANPVDSHTDVQFLHISINVFSNTSNFNFRLNTDESYKLVIQRENSIIKIKIRSGTYFGARHALETLRQLIWFDELSGHLRIIEKVKIFDSPLFAYRGFMLDTSSNFIPVNTIKKTINGMAAVKMNVLHWHLTDSFSFPFYFKNSKHAIYGAYSSKKVYTGVDVKSIVDFALLRGISVLIEMNNPGHMDRGWNWGTRKGYGSLNMCSNNKNNKINCDGPDSCRQIDPSNKYNYQLIKDILTELKNLTGQPEFVHLGGDGIDLMCWKNSTNTRKMDSYKKKGLFGILKYHQNQMYDIVTGINNGNPPNIILSSEYFKPFSDPTKVIDSKIYIAQITGLAEEEEEKILIDKGYRVIVSHSDKWFLNYLPQWTTVYDHRPWEQFLWSEKEQIIGGEAIFQTDFIDERNFDSRLWPSLAAVGEVLWSEPQLVSLLDTTLRLQIFRELLIERGINASPLNPKWCIQNPGFCI